MADRSSASTTEAEARDRAIVERVVAGLRRVELSYKVVRRIAAPRGRPLLAPWAALLAGPHRHRRTPAVSQRGSVRGGDRASARCYTARTPILNASRPFDGLLCVGLQWIGFATVRFLIGGALIGRCAYNRGSDRQRNACSSADERPGRLSVEALLVCIFRY